MRPNPTCRCPKCNKLTNVLKLTYMKNSKKIHVVTKINFCRNCNLVIPKDPQTKFWNGLMCKEQLVTQNSIMEIVAQ